MTRPAPISQADLRGEQADRAGAEHDDHVALDDVAELGAEVAGGQRVGEQDGVLVVHPVRDHASARRRRTAPARTRPGRRRSRRVVCE